MLTFCTLFDSRYLAKGLALYESLAKHTTDFRLYVFGFDDACCDVLNTLNLPNLVVIGLAEFEDEELLQAKLNRSSTEYYWTCTPSAILYVLENYAVDSCTYLDADIYFYDNPECLLNELGKNSVLITSHRYTPKYDDAGKYGKYCVQFMTFKNDENGLLVLRWWRNACLDWCYSKVKDGKFGDQKYLDDWPERFSGIHELEHLGGGVAPWNVQQYEIDCRDLRLRAKSKTSQVDFDVVFYHFQAVKFYENGELDLGPYYLSKDVVNFFYKPYVRHLQLIGEKIARFNDSIDPHGIVTRKKLGGLRHWREHLRRLRRWNIFKLRKL